MSIETIGVYTGVSKQIAQSLQRLGKKNSAILEKYNTECAAKYVIESLFFPIFQGKREEIEAKEFKSRLDTFLALSPAGRLCLSSHFFWSGQTNTTLDEDGFNRSAYDRIFMLCNQLHPISIDLILSIDSMDILLPYLFHSPNERQSLWLSTDGALNFSWKTDILRLLENTSNLKFTIHRITDIEIIFPEVVSKYFGLNDWANLSRLGANWSVFFSPEDRNRFSQLFQNIRRTRGSNFRNELFQLSPALISDDDTSWHQKFGWNNEYILGCREQFRRDWEELVEVDRISCLEPILHK